MPYAFFKVRAHDEGAESERLNAFLRSHRVLAVRNEWVAAAENSFWALCVDFHEGFAPSAGSGERAASPRRIDYKEVLPEDQFAVFVKLRELRKRIAEDEGVPVFTVFTNEQLAEMVKRECRTATDLRKIDGVGEARAGKYAERFLALLAGAAEPSPPLP